MEHGMDKEIFVFDFESRQTFFAVFIKILFLGSVQTVRFDNKFGNEQENKVHEIYKKIEIN